MLKLLAPFAVLAALVPASAPARTLTAHRVASSVKWVGQADPQTVAYQSVLGQFPLFTRNDARVVSTVPAPAGCFPVVAGGGHIAFVCGEDQVVERGARFVRRLAITSLRGDEVVFREQTLPGPDLGSPPDPPSDVGDQWIRTVHRPYHGFAWVDLNWRTGEQRQWDPTDPRRTVDLSSPGLSVPLCSPARAAATPNEAMGDWPSLGAVTVRGRFVLALDASDKPRLWRCGSRRPIRLPLGFTRPVLGDGWLAQQQNGHTRLLRLADRRMFDVRPTAGTPVLTRGRLYVAPYPGGTGDVWTVPLPRH